MGWRWGLIEERATAEEEGTRRGGRREEGESKGEGERKVFEEAKQISLASFKAAEARGLSDISQPMGLANLGLPHLQKGCFGCAFQVTETF